MFEAEDTMSKIAVTPPGDISKLNKPPDTVSAYSEMISNRGSQIIGIVKVSNLLL